MQEAESPENLPPPPVPTSGDHPYAIFRNRNFTFYLLGRLVALFGQLMFAMAVSWELYERTGSALALGLVGLTQMVPMLLFTLPAGHVADNFNRKRVVMWMTMVLAAVSAGVAAISVLHAPVWWIYLCLFVGGTARTFMWAANAAFLPALVDRKVFPRAVNWNVSVFYLSSIVGPATAGGFIAWMAAHHSAAPAAPIYAINALTSLAFCGFISRVRRQHTVAVKEPMTLQALLTGFKFVMPAKSFWESSRSTCSPCCWAAQRRCCRFMRRIFCLSGRRTLECCRRRCRGVPCSACLF